MNLVAIEGGRGNAPATLRQPKTADQMREEMRLLERQLEVARSNADNHNRMRLAEERRAARITDRMQDMARQLERMARA